MQWFFLFFVASNPAAAPKSTDIFVAKPIRKPFPIQLFQVYRINDSIWECMFVCLHRRLTQKVYSIFYFFLFWFSSFTWPRKCTYKTGMQWKPHREMRKYQIEYIIQLMHNQNGIHSTIYTILGMGWAKSKCESRKHKWTKAKGNLKAFIKERGYSNQIVKWRWNKNTTAIESGEKINQQFWKFSTPFSVHIVPDGGEAWIWDFSIIILSKLRPLLGTSAWLPAIQ